MSGTLTRHFVDGDFVDVVENPLPEDARNYELADRNSLKDQTEKSMSGEDENPPAVPPRPNKTNVKEGNPAADPDTQSHLDKDAKGHSSKSKMELEAELNSALTEVYLSAERLKVSHAENASLHKQVGDLTRNLHEQQDFIFSLQPRREQITGSEAALEFNSLCANVEEWVDTNLGNAIDERRMMNEKVVISRSAKDFLLLITPPGQDAFGAPDTDIYNVKAAVMRFLIINIFEPDFYCMGKGMADFVSSIQMSIANLQPRRDIAAQRSWRSETLTAIANRPDFIPARRQQSEELTSKLYAMLSMFLPRHNKSTLTVSIQRFITEPSLLLAHKLQLSVDRYTFNYTDFHKEKPSLRTVIPCNYASFECVDLLRGGKLLKFPEAGEGVAGQGYITYLLDLAPALMFESVAGDRFSEPQILRKPRILVAANRLEHRAFVIPKWTGKHPTLLGWLDDLLYPKRVGRWRSAF